MSCGREESKEQRYEALGHSEETIGPHSSSD